MSHTEGRVIGDNVRWPITVISNRGKTQNDISDQFGLTQCAVIEILSKYRNTDDVKVWIALDITNHKSTRGQTRGTNGNFQSYKHTPALTGEWENNIVKAVLHNTVRRRLKVVGIPSRQPRKGHLPARQQ